MWRMVKRGRAATGTTIWYAVHSIEVIERVKPKKTGPRYLAYENVYLVRARGPAEAQRKGEALGRNDAAPDDTLRWNGSPARVFWGGIRKVVSCAANVKRRGDGLVRKIADGDEATYSLHVIRDRAALRRLIRGRPVEIEYEE